MYACGHIHAHIYKYVYIYVCMHFYLISLFFP